MKYFCHRCSRQLGLIPDPPAGKKVSSAKQYEKHHKHTVLEGRYPIQSVFSDPSTSAYAGHLVDAMIEGAVEVDDLGRKNIVWVAGRETGFRFEYGRLIQPSAAVTVVQSSNAGLIHAYPENSTSFSAGVCEQCGQAIVR